LASTLKEERFRRSRRKNHKRARAYLKWDCW